MTKFILHGGYTTENNDLNQGYFSEMVNDVPDGGIILLVYFAGKEEKIEAMYSQDRARMESLAGDKKITVVKASRKNFIAEVNSADVIYIRGGDTQQLRETLDAYPGFVKAIQGKTVSGSSAGAYVLSKYYFTNSLNQVKEGLGCVPVRTICHYQSERHPAPDNVDPVSAIDEYDNDQELVLLKDYEWRVFEV